MRRAASIAALLFAWACSAGTLLELAQVFAWGRMYAGYARTMSGRDAWRETFDPAKPCEICRAIERARAAGPEAPQTPAPDPTEEISPALFCDAVEIRLVPPPFDARRGEHARRPDEWQAPVPTPPPRRA